MYQSAVRSRFPFLLAAALVAAALVATMVLVTVSLRAKSAPPDDESKGVMKLSLSLGPSDDAPPDYVGYVVKSARGNVVATGSVLVHDPKTPVTADVRLESARGDTVTVFTTTNQNGQPARWFLGSKTFDVSPGQPVRIDLGTVTAGAPARGGAAANAGQAASGDPNAPSTAARTAPLTAQAPSPAASACQTCELSTEQGRCDREFLSARSEDPPSWGCGTLETPREQAACTALLHCLNAADCARGGSPMLGCFCGSAPTSACLGGVGISGDCVDEYQAAAEAGGGPVKGAPVAELARFVSTVATNPRTPVGLADNIKECAAVGHCETCNTL